MRASYHRDKEEPASSARVLTAHPSADDAGTEKGCTPMSDTLSLATRLRALDDAALATVLRARRVKVIGVKDFFDLAEALLAVRPSGTSHAPRP